MSLLFLDSSDHYTNGQLTDKYTSGGGTIATGRHGNGIAGPSLMIALPGIGSTTSIIGDAVKVNHFGASIFFAWKDLGFETFIVNPTNAGAVQFRNFSGTIDISSDTDVLKHGQWYYIEASVTFVPTVGNIQATDVKVWVDGDLVIDVADAGGQTTFGSTPSTYGWLSVIRGAGGPNVHDDFYIADGAGGAPWNANVGDIRIGVIRPNGVGVAAEWTPSPAVPNWQNVNDNIPPDDDTTHVASTTVGDEDVHEMEDVNTGNTVIGAQMLISARRTEEGFARLLALLRHAGVTYDLDERALATSYFFRHRYPFETMPNGDPLTDANINAVQAGYRRTA